MSLFYTLPSITYALIDEASPNSNEHPSTDSFGPRIPYGGAIGAQKRMLVKFTVDNENLFSSILKNIIVSFSRNYARETVYISVLAESFDPETVTWNTRPATFSDCSQSYSFAEDAENGKTSAEVAVKAAEYDWEKIRCAAVYGVELYYSHDYVDTMRPSIRSTQSKVEYEELTAFASNPVPAEGAYIQPNAANIFSWELGTNALPNNPPRTYWPTQTSATVEWRSGEGAATSQKSVGTASSVTLPAGTFTTASVQWRVGIEASNGQKVYSDWISCTTVDAQSTTQLLSPKNTVIDGSRETVFTWRHVIETGTAQTAFELQTSPDGASWETILTESTADTSVTISGGTLPGGDVYWRVRTYNANGSAGEWSEVAHIIVIAAPEAPALIITDDSPHFAIRWQQSGQQAYELKLDGVTLVTRFGAESHYNHDGYLTPGSHNVQVRIQNKYGLWSDWGSAALQITNVEGSAIVLHAEVDNVVTLSWTADATYSAFLVYRDGCLIGQTALRAYADHFALGPVTYQIRGVYADNGNYTVSNSVSVNVVVPCIMVSSVNAPKWKELKLSMGSLRNTELSVSRSVSYQHYIGAALPSAEIGEAISKVYNLDCAFLLSDPNTAQEFESLLGELVCVKEPGGDCYVGILDSLSKKTVHRMYRSYSASITLVDWEEAKT